MRLLAGDRLDADDALMLGLVGKHRGAGNVADRIEAGDVGAGVAVNDNRAAFDLHAELLEAEILDVPDDTGGRDQAICPDLLRLAILLDRRGYRVLLLHELRDLGVG